VTVSSSALPLECLAVLKADIFGTVAHCRQAGQELIVRDVRRAHGPLSRFLGRRLANREARALRQLDGIAPDRMPRSVGVASDLFLRSYIPGRSLRDHPQANPDYYSDALDLLRRMHAAGVVHNDLEKPENWLVTTDGRPAIVDFQIAMIFANTDSWLFRLGAREDLRHLYKNKRRFCREALTEAEAGLVKRKSWMAMLNARTFKPVYRLITRRMLGFSDRAHSRHSR
jgi:predicted Ser/Thr protein kinase